jgi:hypothetical protein
MKDVFRLRQSQTVLEDVKYFFSLQRQKPVFMYYNSWYRPRKKAKKKVQQPAQRVKYGQTWWGEQWLNAPTGPCHASTSQQLSMYYQGRLTQTPFWCSNCMDWIWWRN